MQRGRRNACRPRWEKVVSKQSYDEGTPKAADHAATYPRTSATSCTPPPGHAQAQTHVGCSTKRAKRAQITPKHWGWIVSPPRRATPTARQHRRSVCGWPGVPRDYDSATPAPPRRGAGLRAGAEKYRRALPERGGRSAGVCRSDALVPRCRGAGNRMRRPHRLADQYGEGVPADYADAARWYCKAADQGQKPAKANFVAIGNNPAPSSPASIIGLCEPTSTVRRPTTDQADGTAE